MFSRLKKKLQTWTQKVSKEAEEKKEKPVETTDKKKKEIKIPSKFDVAKQKYEPDLEKIKKIGENLGAKKQNIFQKATSKARKVKVSEKAFEIYEEELKMLLLENNVAFDVADRMVTELKTNIIGKEFLKKELESEIQDCFKQIISKILIEPYKIEKKIKAKKDGPYVILFCGINGTGKTTSIAKIAEKLKKKNISSVLAAADTFRAASIEQIREHGKKLGIKVISQNYGTDPASVGFDAIKYAKKNNIDCVLIDTAGRMHTSKNLLKEIEKIARVTKPDLKIFVGESITGNDAMEQVKSFDWEIGIDGIMLTKADIDEKGGTALSVGYVTKKPILYLGIGQNYGDVEQFDKKKFIKRLGL